MREAERDHAVVHDRIAGGERNPRRRAEGKVRNAFFRDAAADRRTGTVTAADDNGRSFAQSALCRRIRRDPSGDRNGRDDVRIFVASETADSEQFVRPLQIPDVHQSDAGCVRRIGQKYTGQAEDDIVLCVECFVRFPVGFRFVFLQPHQFRRTVRRTEPLSGERIVVFIGNLPADAVFFRRGTHIRPDQRIPHRNAVPIHAETAHHMSAERNGFDVRRGNRRLFDEKFRGFADRAPPVVRILFGAVTRRDVQTVGIHGTFDQRPVRGEQRRLVAGGTEVVCKQIGCHDFLHPCRLIFSIIAHTDAGLQEIFTGCRRFPENPPYNQ